MERTTTTTTTGFSGEPFTSTNNFEPPLMKKRSNKDKDKDKNQRRFSDEQIKLLETMFESETRLEPKKKVELARELGLQPRQVAIWFQNKRARWKSKQVEQDLRALRAEYESLVSKFEVLKEEKQSLISQLEKLNDVLRRSHDEDSKDGGSSTKNTDPEGDLANLKLQEGLEEREAYENTNNNINVENLAHHNDHELAANTSQQADVSLGSLENWYRHDLGGVFDQSRAQWLNYWL